MDLCKTLVSVLRMHHYDIGAAKSDVNCPAMGKERFLRSMVGN